MASVTRRIRHNIAETCTGERNFYHARRKLPVGKPLRVEKVRYYAELIRK